MQYRYAISPIVYSLQDIEKTIGQYDRVFRTTRGFEREDVEFDEKMQNFVWRGLTAASYVGRHKHRIFLKRNYDPVTLLDGFLKNISLNPITSSWELVPLSFVADWFVNIGDVLAAYTGPTLHIGEGCTYSIQRDIEFKLGTSKPIYDVKIQSYRRNIIDPSSLAGFTLNFDLPWKRKLDALALAWSYTKNDWTKLLLKRKP
uniref:Maturation n=1 Tax=Leviviridae sp. TaxID=2027243 RepID=A0A142D885_9VIRU|nr:maturation [Leviviridae sp.]